MSLNNHTILYIDDDRDDLQMLKEAVSRVDGSYHVVEATNGEQGLRHLENMKKDEKLPCLIVLDINMPKIDGRQAFRMIRNDKALSSIPIVIFSTSNSSIDKLFFDGKDVEYLTKPIDFISLLQVASKLLSYCKN
jgi:CheY-like chemotaxis protein